MGFEGRAAKYSGHLRIASVPPYPLGNIRANSGLRGDCVSAWATSAPWVVNK